jgi:hypothetical protein
MVNEILSAIGIKKATPDKNGDSYLLFAALIKNLSPSLFKL